VVHLVWAVADQPARPLLAFLDNANEAPAGVAGRRCPQRGRRPS